jgi:hypothetical protein
MGMARRIVHQLVDDIDGTLLEVGDGETIHFSLGGTAYEIDLNDAHAEELRAAFAPYIKAGRRAGTASGTRGRSSARKASNASAIREWASANGYKVSDRGRVSAEIQAAYEAAH